jgi:hypothetical protein
MSSHDPPESTIGRCRLVMVRGIRAAADMLVDLAVGSAELFHTAIGIAYANLVIDGHRETLAGPQPTLSGLVTAPKF